MDFCSYCGYVFSDGTAKTLTVEENYVDILCRNSDYKKYNGYSKELTYERIYYNGYNYRWLPQNTNEVKGITMETVLTLAAGVSIVLLLIVLAVLILLL